MLTLRKWTWCQVYFGSLQCQVCSLQQGVFDPLPAEHPLTHYHPTFTPLFEKISCTNRLWLLNTDLHGVLISAFIVGYAPFYLFCGWRAAGACSEVLPWWALQKERRLTGEDRYSWVRLDWEYCYAASQTEQSSDWWWMKRLTFVVVYTLFKIMLHIFLLSYLFNCKRRGHNRSNSPGWCVS